MKRLATLVLLIGFAIAPAMFAEEEKKGGAPEPNIGWEWANFAILAGVLGYLASKQGGPFFAARAADIRKGIDSANQVKADSDAKVAAINSKLGRLDVEIASLRESAANERRAAEQRLKDDTASEIQRIQAHAENEIESAGKSERLALRSYAAQLAMELAEAKARARMGPDTESTLVQAFVNGLDGAASHTHTLN